MQSPEAQVADITRGVVGGGAGLCKLAGWMVGWLGSDALGWVWFGLLFLG